MSEPDIQGFHMIYALISLLEAQYDGMQVGFDIGYPSCSKPASEEWFGLDRAIEIAHVVLGAPRRVQMCHWCVLLASEFRYDFCAGAVVKVLRRRDSHLPQHLDASLRDPQEPLFPSHFL
eukprot:1435280-Amphidinium_carterae.1